MNKTQDMIAGKVSSMVSEHFSHALLVFSSDELDDDDFVCLRFFGGALTGILSVVMVILLYCRDVGIIKIQYSETNNLDTEDY